MHRSKIMSRSKFLILFLGLGALASAQALPAQDRPAPASLPPAVDAPRGEEPPRTSILIPIGGNKQLQMKTGKVIRTVVNSNDRVATVQPIQGNQTTVNVTGRDAGTTRIVLTDVDNAIETYDVVVQLDIEYLRTVLQRTMPTANLQLIPAAANTVIISGNVNHAEDVDVIMRTATSVLGGPDRVINALRIGGVMQVQLDVVVAFVSRSELRRMSFDFNSVGLHHNISSTVGGALLNPAPGNPITLGFPPGIINSVGNPNGAPANFFLALFNDKQQFFGFLQALKNEGLAKIMAQPSLVTLSGRSATLLSGGQQAIPEAQGLGTISVRFENFGTQLTFLPVVLGNGKIRLEVQPEVSELDATVGTTIAGTFVPGRNTQSVHTTVEIEDGQTLAIGGLIQNVIIAQLAKVPVLGELPYLGALFSSKSFNETESELVVLVTPHLVDPMDCSQLPKLLPGQETRSPDDFELFFENLLEAPRGPREIRPGGHYVPAFKHGPTVDTFPCGDTSGFSHGGGCGAGGCGGAAPAGGCTTGACGAANGAGLVDGTRIGYHGNDSMAPAQNSAVSGTSGRSADLLAPIDVADMPNGVTRASGMIRAGESKPAPVQ